MSSECLGPQLRVAVVRAQGAPQVTVTAEEIQQVTLDLGYAEALLLALSMDFYELRSQATQCALQDAVLIGENPSAAARAQLPGQGQLVALQRNAQGTRHALCGSIRAEGGLNEQVPAAGADPAR